MLTYESWILFANILLNIFLLIVMSAWSVLDFSCQIFAEFWYQYYFVQKYLEVFLLFSCSRTVQIMLEVCVIYRFIRIPCETIWSHYFLNGYLVRERSNNFSYFFYRNWSIKTNYIMLYFSRKLCILSNFSKSFAHSRIKKSIHLL